MIYIIGIGKQVWYNNGICYIINRHQNSPLLTSRILSFTNANSVSVNVASSDALSDDGVSLNPPVGLYVIGY